MIKGSGNARRARQQHMQQRRRPQQQYHQQQNQQNQQHQQQLPQIDKPQSVADLKKLLETYGSAISAENRAFITELVNGLENGADKSQLLGLAARMQAAAQKQNK